MVGSAPPTQPMSRTAGSLFGERKGIRMTVTYDKEIAALLVIDPYNDFISEGGKLWDRLKAVAEAEKKMRSGIGCVPISGQRKRHAPGSSGGMP
jgi:hypothetical protein